MKCQTTRIKSLMGFIMLIIGVLVGVCAKFLTHNTAFQVEYLYGVSCGLIVASITVIIIHFIRNKNEKIRQQNIISEQDERNQFIATRSYFVAYTYLFYSIVLCFVLDLFIPLSFHWMALILILSTCAVQGIAALYYSKKY